MTSASGYSLDPIAPRDQAEVLARALPYIRRFHGKTSVIKYVSNAMTDPALQQDFAKEIVPFKLVDVNPIVVHDDGGPQIDEALASAWRHMGGSPRALARSTARSNWSCGCSNAAPAGNVPIVEQGVALHAGVDIRETLNANNVASRS